MANHFQKNHICLRRPILGCGKHLFQLQRNSGIILICVICVIVTSLNLVAIANCFAKCMATWQNLKTSCVKIVITLPAPLMFKAALSQSLTHKWKVVLADWSILCQLDPLPISQRLTTVILFLLGHVILIHEDFILISPKFGPIKNFCGCNLFIFDRIQCLQALLPLSTKYNPISGRL